VEDADYEYKVGFQGVEGAFSHQALIEYFGKDAEASCYSGFRHIFHALEKGEIKYGILPLENSSTGGISEVYDLLGEYGFYIVGEKCIKVDHNLLGIKGAEVSEIKEVYSHLQGFMQSKDYFDCHSEWQLIPYHNTARSALYISRENLKSKACVASKIAAELYGLDILKENVNDNSNNYTRFIVISRDLELDSSNEKITIVTTLPHKVGSLYRLVKHFADNNSNLLKIESRPIMGKPWEYAFYIDFQGNMLLDDTRNILEGIKTDGLNYKFLGNYKAEVTI
jgi:chorismate mutase/prephenate dehydratase